MTERCSYIIVGNGIAGITAAETLHNEDASAEITVVADHPLPVYTRPALKEYLAGRTGEEDLFARRRSFYADHNIHFVFDRAVGISVNAHRIRLRSGRKMSYDRLLLAPGAHARRLACPGSDLVGVVALRTLADFQSALQLLESAHHVVVVGAGPVALESIEILRHRGFQVTHLLRGQKLWPDVLDATASSLVIHQERREGVDVRTGDEIVEIAGKEGRVVGVITQNGARIPCDMVITAIGAEPVIDFISASGIPCGRGVKVDHCMHTGAPDVFAAGDVAEVIDTITGQSRCIGQWYPAIQQGRTAAYAMLGLLGTHHLLQPMKHSNAYLRSITTSYLFGFEIAAVGILAPPAQMARSPDYQEIFADPGSYLYSKAVLKDGIPIGVLSFDGRRDMLSFKRAIDHAVCLAPVASYLFARDFKFATWLDRQKVPTPVLAVRKARGASLNDSDYPTRPVPAHSMKSQFASLGAMRLRANGDPYTMPVVTVSSRDKDDPPPSPTAGCPPGASLHMGGPPHPEEEAFLAPILPVETVRALYKATPGKGDHRYHLSLERDRTQGEDADDGSPSSLAPEWSHTRLNPGEIVTIGRDSASTLAIDHSTISRRHAEITCENGCYLLRDLGSKNGTFVNGVQLEPYQPHVLQSRDQVRIGTLLTYMFDVRPVSNVTGRR